MTDKTKGAPARSALKLALEALKQIDEAMPFPVAKLAQQVIREALAEQLKRELYTGEPAQPQQEPSTLFESFQEFGEGWERLAWELCADENGEEACNDLIWEGGPIPEPWGDRWLKYEDEAKRLIALVQKHTSPPAQRTWVGLTDEEVMVIAFDFDVPSLVVRTVEAKLKEKNSD